jgi:hypothetical protein
MTNEEFDRAIEAIGRGQITPREGRVLAAAIFIMRELSNMTDAQAWEPTRTQVVEFINSLNKPLRRMLKQVADTAKEKKHTLH